MVCLYWIISPQWCAMSWCARVMVCSCRINSPRWCDPCHGVLMCDNQPSVVWSMSWRKKLKNGMLKSDIQPLVVSFMSRYDHGGKSAHIGMSHVMTISPLLFAPCHSVLMSDNQHWWCGPCHGVLMLDNQPFVVWSMS